jgi:peptidoglycan/LPS O-acetylase OafA/YrhL
MRSNGEDRPNLDMLRSIAVATVLIDHLIPTLKYQTGYSNLMLERFTVHIGSAGVIAFFVHTSLVLMYSLDRLDRSGHDPVALRFYIRRFFRIYPLSITCIGVVLFFGIPAMTWRSTDPITWKVVASNLLLVQNIWTKQSVLGPLWSLPYEVQMYLVLPLLHRFARRNRPVLGLFALTGFFCSVGTLLAATSGHLNMAAYIPCFLAGVLCYALERSQRQVIPAFLWPWWVLTLIICYCVANLGSPNPLFWVGWIYCLVLGCSANLFCESQNTYVNGLFRRIATYSYGLYLWHVPALYVVFSYLKVHDPLLGTLLFILFALLVSVVTYHLIEAPMVKTGCLLSNNALIPSTQHSPVSA